MHHNHNPPPNAKCRPSSLSSSSFRSISNPLSLSLYSICTIYTEFIVRVQQARGSKSYLVSGELQNEKKTLWRSGDAKEWPRVWLERRGEECGYGEWRSEKEEYREWQSERMVMVNIQGSEKENSEGPSEMNRKKKQPKQQAQKQLKNSLVLLQQCTFPTLLKIYAI